MRSDYTDITVILDRSGSMETVRADTIGGFNRFVADQKLVPGKATLSLYQFDTIYEAVHRGIPLKEVPALTHETFVPRGGTALLDAIGRATNETGARLAAMPEAERPGKVVVVMLTDGEENSSREFARDKVFEMIKHQTEAFRWEYLFLGASQDAIRTGASIGIKAASSMTYANNSVGTQAAFASASSNLRSYRTGAKMDASFEAEDRKLQWDAGAKPDGSQS